MSLNSNHVSCLCELSIEDFTNAIMWRDNGTSATITKESLGFLRLLNIREYSEILRNIWEYLEILGNTRKYSGSNRY